MFKTRQFATLILTQAACLIVGLVMQSRFAAAAANDGSTEQFLVQVLTFVWVFGLQGGIAWAVLNRMQGEHAQLRTQSQEESLIQTRELVRTRDAVIFGLAKLAESRDSETGHHLERIAMYATRLATAARRHPAFRNRITVAMVESIGVSSALHDIGKVGVEDAVLLKPDRLTDEEYEKIKIHPKIAGDCIEQIQRRLGDSNFLRMAKDIALYHHERWDGKGYPHGLAGEDIPVSARIVAIVDVYDALTSRRVYKDPYPHAVCIEKIRAASGTQFDPVLIEVFLAIQEQFRDIAARHQDLPVSDPDTVMSADQEKLLTETVQLPVPKPMLPAATN